MGEAAAVSDCKLPGSNEGGVGDENDAAAMNEELKVSGLRVKDESVVEKNDAVCEEVE